MIHIIRYVYGKQKPEPLFGSDRFQTHFWTASVAFTNRFKTARYKPYPASTVSFRGRRLVKVEIDWISLFKSRDRNKTLGAFSYPEVANEVENTSEGVS